MVASNLSMAAPVFDWRLQRINQYDKQSERKIQSIISKGKGNGGYQKPFSNIVS